MLHNHFVCFFFEIFFYYFGVCFKFYDKKANHNWKKLLDVRDILHSRKMLFEWYNKNEFMMRYLQILKNIINN